jgi:predicted metal-dependent enzyme (double-stranded beta helix superfamily)
MPFSLDNFLDECRAAAGSQHAVREIVERAVSDRAAVVREIGEPTRGQIQTLYHSPELTVLNVVWAPKMVLFPHDHTIWAVIGIYGGREDNIFWRRLPGTDSRRVEAAGARSLSDGDAVALGHDVIHSVTNPIARLTGAIHVYGGDYFNAHRKEWDPETLSERPCDVQRLVRLFEEENHRWIAAP